MGRFILPPLKFILFFVVSTSVFLFFSLIYQWGQWVSLSNELSNSLLLFLPEAASGIIFPGASAALLFTFFDYRKKPINPVAVIITAAVIFMIFFFGFRITASMQNNSESYTFQPFNERKLHITDENLIYIDSISKDDTSEINNLVLRNKDNDNSSFKYHKDARLINEQTPYLEFSSEQKLNITPSNPVFNDSFKANGLLTSYLSDMKILNRTIRNSAIKGGENFIMLVAAFTAFLMACLLFKGATAWPLFEIVLILTFHRLVYYLFVLFSNEADFISDVLFGGQQLQNIPLFTLSGLTLIIFLSGLFIKLTSGRRYK